MTSVLCQSYDLDVYLDSFFGVLHGEALGQVLYSLTLGD